ncbi:hypothetical protein GQ600_14869 [Phytophthora cactorum]|nr:hypothetical protein GQ600_14869 [Phytophthora cactorum]
MAEPAPAVDEAARLESGASSAKGSTEYNLKLDVNSLRESLWSSKLSQNAAVLKAVEQYYAVFKQGLHNPRPMQLGFLRVFLDPNVKFGDARGLKDLLEQWHRYTQFHAWIETGFVSAEVFGSTDSPIVVAQGTLTVLMNRATLEKIFPRALEEPELAAVLMNHVIEYRTTTTFSFNERGQVERLDWDVDFLSGISNLFGSAIDASRVLQGALLREGAKLSASVDDDTSDGRRQGSMVERELAQARQGDGSRARLSYIMT